jgi:glucose-6-phosphate 3-dehydrogenase
VDAVIIATPNDAHFAHVISALDRGVRVLCEKPLAASVPEAEALVLAAQGAAAPASVGFNYRFLPAVQRLRTLISTGQLGELRTVAMSWRRSSARAGGERGWRASERNRDTGGALGDLGVHLIDLLEYLTGAAIEAVGLQVLTANRASVGGGGGSQPEDWAKFSGRLESRATFAVEVSKAAPPAATGLDFHILASGGEAHLALGPSRARELTRVGSTVTDKSLPASEPAATEVPGWTFAVHGQLTEWLAVRQGQTLATFSDGLRAQHHLERMHTIATSA